MFEGFSSVLCGWLSPFPAPRNFPALGVRGSSPQILASGAMLPRVPSHFRARAVGLPPTAPRFFRAHDFQRRHMHTVGWRPVRSHQRLFGRHDRRGLVGLARAAGLGEFIGGRATRTSLDQNAGWANSDLIFGGGFARYAFGKSFLQAAVQGGPSQNSTSRTIASNLAPNLQAATANYDGWYISPEMTYGLRQSLGSYNGVTWTMMPNLRVRYLYGAFDGVGAVADVVEIWMMSSPAFSGYRVMRQRQAVADPT